MMAIRIGHGRRAGNETRIYSMHDGLTSLGNRSCLAWWWPCLLPLRGKHTWNQSIHAQQKKKNPLPRFYLELPEAAISNNLGYFKTKIKRRRSFLGASIFVRIIKEKTQLYRSQSIILQKNVISHHNVHQGNSLLLLWLFTSNWSQSDRNFMFGT